MHIDLLESTPNLAKMFADQAHRLGDAPLFWAKREGTWHSISWAEAHKQATALARALIGSGVRPGDRVAIVGENRPEWAIGDLAIVNAGAISVPGYTTNTVEDHRHILSNSGAKGVIVSTRPLAEKVIAAVPSLEMVRFANSGSEAVGTAVRLARTYTGRRKILRFEGMYHGWMDTVYWSNHPKLELAGPDEAPIPVPAGSGMAPGVGEGLVIAQWNDAAALERTLEEHRGEIAAILTEPMMLNTGCIMPVPGYLARMRELADRHGALLIFDEVITGFRLARGGGQERFGVLPDLTTMAKGIGGGFPVAAIGGRREVMSLIADGRYSHSGTYNSNVLAMADRKSTRLNSSH